MAHRLTAFTAGIRAMNVAEAKWSEFDLDAASTNPHNAASEHLQRGVFSHSAPASPGSYRFLPSLGV